MALFFEGFLALFALQLEWPYTQLGKKGMCDTPAINEPKNESLSEQI